MRLLCCRACGFITNDASQATLTCEKLGQGHDFNPIDAPDFLDEVIAERTAKNPDVGAKVLPDHWTIYICERGHVETQTWSAGECMRCGYNLVPVRAVEVVALEPLKELADEFDRHPLQCGNAGTLLRAALDHG